MRFVVENVAL